MVQNKGLIFKACPTGWPVIGEHLAVEARDFDLSAPPPADSITIQHSYASYDPYLRGKMRDQSIKSYSPAFELHKPFYNRGIAKVLKSSTPTFRPGDFVVGMMTFEEYSAVPADQIAGLRKLTNPYKLPESIYIGALGMPGLTAYSSLYEIGKPKKGETIFVSAASGAVGQLVGQLAKHEGLHVIGSVGSDDKLDFILKELGFDSGFNYKKEKASEALARLAPNGIDIYYENVGGEQLEAAITHLNPFGRIVACGMISQYNLPSAEQYPIRNLMNVVSKRLSIRGFIVGDSEFGPKWSTEHQEKVAKWISEGTFKAQESVTEGMDKAAEGFLGMLKGENFGKAVLKIADLK